MTSSAVVDAVREALTTLAVHCDPSAPLSAADRATLTAFPGWGPAATVFDWGDADGPALKALTGVDDWQAAGRVVDTSFYTPTQLIEQMWQTVGAAGFTGGRVLDIGCGSGRFATHAPTDLVIDYTGVDVDPVAAAIAARLHPAATIHAQALQQVTLDAHFDVAIGNLPFSKATVTDRSIDFVGSLHRYCLTRAVRSVRPGGYVVAVTSRYELDSGWPDREIAERADLLAAVRLPSRYFAREGTDVVADVLILRVRELGEADAAWPYGRRALPDPRGYSTPQVSEYWTAHPAHVAGTLNATGFHRSPIAVHADDREAAVVSAFSAAANHLRAMSDRTAPAGFADVPLADAEGRKEGSFHLIGDQMWRVHDGRLVPNRKTRELVALVELRDAATCLIAAEADWDRHDDDVAPQRADCARLYRDYVAAFGPINRGEAVDGLVDADTGAAQLRWKAPSLGGFRRDPDAPVVAALELYDRDTEQARPAPILLRRVNKRPEPITHAATAAEALAISLGEGGLDLSRIAGLLDLPTPAAAFSALGELVFDDPATGAVVCARDYLSGDVRVKLGAARQAALGDARFTRNVDALERVQPAWLGSADIRIELGSPLVSSDDIEAFCAQEFGCRWATVTREIPTATWTVDAGSATAQAAIDYGTTDKTPVELLTAGLNHKVPVVTRHVTVAARMVRRRDETATEAAALKLAALATRFSVWVWEDHDRAARIAHDYNTTFNSHVVRPDDGSYLRFPGLADGVTLYPWQRDFVDRALSLTGGVYNASAVGLGKTLAAVATAMMLRQFGIANKPLIAVPNHILEQFATIAMQSFPTGKFLIVRREDLTKQNRRLFAARAATSDWDLIVMTHEGFSSLPVPADVEYDWLQRELTHAETFARSSGRQSKSVAALIRSLEDQLATLRESVADRDMITFDQLGVDHISIDEADRFRRLPVKTKADGFSLGSSKRALDLMLKVDALRERNPDRPCFAAYSGTPLVNTLAEAYVVTRLCQPALLAAAGVEHFDAWAAQFVRYESIVEAAPDGNGLRTKRRPAVIQNVPELRNMLRQFMFMVDEATVSKSLTRPEARFHTMVADPSAAISDAMAALAARADDLRTGKVADPTVDNPLKIYSDGRALSVDPALVGVRDETPFPATKLGIAAANIARIHRDTRMTTYPGSDVPGSFQFVMCDLGTPHGPDARTYGRLRAELARLGVPANEIRFVQDCATPKSREALFAMCRSGAVRVAIASTLLGGVGVNVQDRLCALHNLDPTFTPAAFDQRVGRGIRAGNMNPAVDIYSYVTEHTFDAVMYSVVERKSRGHAELYRLGSTIREIEDISESALTFTALKVAASGNPLLFTQHQLTTKVRALRIARATVIQNVRAANYTAEQHRAVAAARAERADLLADVATHHADLRALVRRATDELTVRSGRPDLLMRARIGGQPMTLRTTDGGAELDVQWGRRTLTRIAIPASMKRHDTITKLVAAELRSWVNTLDATIAELRAGATAASRDAADVERAAQSATFGQQAELDASEAELAAVEARIHALATEASAAAA